MPIVEHVVLPAALFTLMLAMGLSLTVANFLDVLRFRAPLFVGIASLGLLLPALGFLLARAFPLAPVLAAGLVMTATCPGGTFANVLTYFARGDLALSISLTALTSLVAVVTIPLYATVSLAMFVGEARVLDVPVLDTIIRVFALTVVPVALGVFIHDRWPKVAARFADPLRNIAALLIFTLFLLIIIGERAELLEALERVWAPVVCLNVVSIVTGFALSKLFRQPHARLTALTIQHTIKQEGTGIYVAVTILGLPLMALPLLVNSVVGLALGTIFAWWARRRALAASSIASRA